VEEIRAVSLIILGWLLGILSDPIVKGIQNARLRASLQNGLLAELVETQVNMAFIAYKLRGRLLSVTQEFLAGLQPIFESYDGPEKDERLVEAIRGLGKLTDDQLKYMHSSQNKPGRAVGLCSTSLPFLSSQVHMLSVCQPDFRQRILRIKAHVDLFNQQVMQAMGFLEKTFDQSITGDNRLAVEGNLEEGYEAVARRAEVIIDCVSELRSRYALTTH